MSRFSSTTKTEGAPAITSHVINSAGVAELLEAGKALGKPIEVAGHRPGVLVPEGFKFEPLPFAQRAPLPDHVRQSVTFDDAESFISYVKLWKRPESVIFAQLPRDGKSPRFGAVFDYHTRESKDDGKEQAAARCAHIATYPCPLSEEWKVWSAINGQTQNQMAFIDFVDANSIDIVRPESASLMELAMNFESRTDVVFQTKIDRVTSGRQLSYKENVEAGANGGTIKVPDALEIFVPVFEGGQKYSVNARLEWIPRDGKLKVIVHLKRPVDVVRLALADIRATIEAGTEMGVLNGVAVPVAD